MTVTVQIVDGPLASIWPPSVSGAGAVILFEGVVRGLEHDREIAGLDYTTYEPMAQRTLEQIGREVAARHGILEMHIEHSRGHVPVGAISFRLVVAGAHRKEAIAAMDEFIDQMKRDVPIWKSSVEL